MNKNILSALLAAALFGIPVISIAENLVSAEDPLDFKAYSVEISAYEGDPAAGTKTFMAIGITKADPGTVVYVKDLSLHLFYRSPRVSMKLFAQSFA